MKLTIKKTIILTFCVLLVISLISQGISFYCIKLESNAGNKIVDTDFAKYVNMQKYAKTISQQVLQVRGYLITGDISYIDKYNSIKEESKVAYQKVQSLLVTDLGKKLIKEAQADEENLHDVFQKCFDAKMHNKEDELAPLVSKSNSYVGKLFARLEEIESIVFKNIEDSRISKDKETASRSTLSLILLLIAVITTFGIGIILADKISKPLKLITNALKSISEGDLKQEKITVKVNTVDLNDLKMSFNTMLNNTKNLIKQTHSSSNIVALSANELMSASKTASSTTEEIAASIQQVALGAEKQNCSLSEASNSMSELTKGVEQTANSVKDIYSEVEVLDNLSENSKVHIQTLTKQMNIISETSINCVSRVKSLEEKSKTIQSIVEVITSISKQTNLLALNAAIEAARAGDAGKGFAVVADEIRKLAEQSTSSTHSILNIVSTVQKEIDDVIAVIEKEESDIEEGLKMANEVSESYSVISRGIDEITSRIQDVTSVTQQMFAGTEQILNTIRSVAQISVENAAISEEVTASVEEHTSSVEEMTAATTSLTELSATLMKDVTKFRL